MIAKINVIKTSKKQKIVFTNYKACFIVQSVKNISMGHVQKN